MFLSKEPRVTNELLDTVLQFYLEFSQFTYSGQYESDLKKTLPRDIRELGILTRGQLMHPMVMRNGNTGSNWDLRYGDTTQIPWTRQREEDNFPTVASMLAELFRRDDRGLTLYRPADKMLIASCRSISILMVSFLKTLGIPARVRSGFVSYFNVNGLPSELNVDHWVIQYWDNERTKWVMIDVDGCKEDSLQFDPFDIPDEHFIFSANAWLSVRQANDSGDRFWNAGGTNGLITIAWELFYDFHCLMNNEIIYSHVPELAHFGKFDQLTESQLLEIDELARLMQDPDQNFLSLREIWNTKSKFRLVKGGAI